MNKDKFTQEEKNYIEELKETKILTCTSRDLTPKEFDIYEGKILFAEMIREKGQTKTMFEIDRKSIRINAREFKA